MLLAFAMFSLHNQDNLKQRRTRAFPSCQFKLCRDSPLAKSFVSFDLLHPPTRCFWLYTRLPAVFLIFILIAGRTYIIAHGDHETSKRIYRSWRSAQEAITIYGYPLHDPRECLERRLPYHGASRKCAALFTDEGPVALSARLSEVASDGYRVQKVATSSLFPTTRPGCLLGPDKRRRWCP